MQQLIKRLELIKTSIVLGDTDVVELQIERIAASNSDDVVSKILETLSQQQWSAAIELIDDFLKSHTGVVIYEDPELAALKIELKENEEKVEQLSELYDERVYMLESFQYRYQTELGDAIRAILQLEKKIKKEEVRQKQEKFEKAQAELHKAQSDLDQLKQERTHLESQLEDLDLDEDEYAKINEKLESVAEDVQQKQEQVRSNKKKAHKAKEKLEESPEHKAYEEAKNTWDSFEKNHEEVIQEERIELEGDEQEELSKCFKRAARLCHPDVVADEFQEQAHDMMQRLNEARIHGDLKTIQEIDQKLQLGMGFVVASDKLTDKVQIRTKIEQLQQRITELKEELETIENSSSWQLIPQSENWDDYFNDLQTALDHELKKRQEQFDQMTDELQMEKLNEEMYRENRYPQIEEFDDYWQEEF